MENFNKRTKIIGNLLKTGRKDNATFAAMYLKDRREQFFYLSVYILAFTVSMPFIYQSVAIGLLGAAWLAQGNFQGKMKRLASPGYIIWMLFYVLHALSYFYSNNKGESSFDLQSKMSLFLLPLLIGTGAEMDGKRIPHLFFSYVCSITAAALYCMIKALYLYNITHNPNYFFYHTLIKGLEANAVYVAWYVIFSLFILLFYRWDKYFTGRTALVKWIMLCIQLLFFILLSSKLLLVMFFVLLIPAGYTSFIRKRDVPVAAKVLAPLLAASIAAGVFFTDNPVQERYKEVTKNHFEQLFANDYSNRPLELNNLTIRIFVWRVCLDNMREHNLWWKGCGNGDVHDLQNNKMKELKLPEFTTALAPKAGLHNMNLHNMYLQTFMMLGIPGLLCFMAIIILPFFLMRKMKYGMFYLLFHLVSALFMLQEAALQTQAGIVYFTFFSVIFLNCYYTSVKKTIQAPPVN